MKSKILKYGTNSSLMLKKIYLTIVLMSILGLYGFGQTTGDYRSAITGNWTSLATWQRYNGTAWVTPTVGQGYPGQNTGTGSVTIRSGHIVTIGTSGLTTQPLGIVTIENTGQLYLTGSNSLVTFFINSLELIVYNGGSIYFFNKSKLVLAANAVLFVGLNGLLGDCNNNNEIWIGPVQFAACAGAPGTIFTFAQIMNAAGTIGGTLNSDPTSNSPLCDGGTINLTGNYTGAFGTVPTYSWDVTDPGGGITNYTTQNVTITNAIVGIYSAKLTVSTVLNGTPYSNSQTISVIVNQLPTLAGASQALTVCEGSSATINLAGLVPSTTFTVSYSINGILQSAITGLIASATGTSSFSTPALTFANNGQNLQITGITITNPSSNCKQTFAQNVTLAVWRSGSWIGITNTDWNTASNWCGLIPTSTSDVYILPTATFQPVIGFAGGVCHDITINPGASLTISGSNTLSIAGNWINNGTFTPNSSTVIFNGTSAISGASINSFNNISINTGKSLTAPSANINIAGNFNNNGSFTHNGGQVTFNGTADQMITNATFYDLSINNSTRLASVFLISPVTVTNNLKLLTGIINARTKSLILDSNSTVSGANNNSHVAGLIKKVSKSNSSFTFPSGDGRYYRPIGIINASKDTWTASYDSVAIGNPASVKELDSPQLHHASGIEHWELSPAINGSAAKVMLSWNNRSDVLNPSTTAIAHWNISNNYWESIGPVSFDINGKTLISLNPWNSFSSFTLGSTLNDGSLPVELISYKIKCVQTGSLLTWTTASEVNNEYFTVEKTEDMLDWKIVTYVSGAFNSNQEIQYSSIDTTLVPDKVTYYRLKQTDVDGAYKYFKVLAILCSFANDILDIIGINVSENNINLIVQTNGLDPVQVYISDISGRLLAKKEITPVKGANIISIEVSDLSSEIYIASISQHGKTKSKKIYISKN